MLKLDFMNEQYNLEQIIDAYTDGSLDNFKGDEDFLTFIISYSLGDNLEGPDADKYKEYARYDGLLNIMRLDEYGYFGKKMYQIYEICEKDKIKFMRVCDMIGKYSIKHWIEKETIDRNLELKEPVSFLDDSIVLSTGTIPKHEHFRYGITYDEEQEYKHELERSLRRRINESIKKNNENISLLEEMPSYVEKERLEQEALEAKRVKDDYEININNIYYGKETLDLSGGLFNMNMGMISWFEDTSIGMLNYRVFRSVPEGDYCLLDNEGNIHIPEEVVKKDNINIGPNSPIRKVQIASIPKLFELGIKKLEQDPIQNEVTILRLKSMLEILENKEKLTVGELKNYEEVIRILYEDTFGPMFKDNDDEKDFVVDSDSPKKI